MISWALRTYWGISRWFTQRPDDGTESWSEKLLGWFVSGLSNGIISFIEKIEPEGLSFVDPALAQIENNPDVPAEIKAMLQRIRAGGQPVPLLLAIPLAVILILPIISSLAAPLGNVLRYGSERIFKSGRLDPETALRAYWRGFMPEDKMRDTLRDYGLDDADIETFLEVSHFYPPPADLVRWQAREVFEPEMVEKYGLDDELGGIEKEPFYKAGMTDEQIRNYWRAHWEHASWNQVVEMLRRGQLEEDDIRAWFRLVEIPPFWRDKLIAISWAVPTRVDVRRFWDMQTIDEDRLREIYMAQGYHDKDLDDYVLWTKVYVAFPDLIARWRNGWLTMDDVRDELAALGMPPDRVDQLIQTKIQAEEPERISAERDLTKTDIYKGVKQNRISRAQATELLQELGYDMEEADYLLDINIPVDEQDDQDKFRQLTKSDIKTAVRELLLPADAARDRLLDLRYSPADADLLIAIYTAAIPLETVEAQRDLTKSDIGRALKNGILTTDEARGYLLSLRYSAEDADLLLELDAPPPELVPAEEARQLTKSDIRNSYLSFVMSPDEAIIRLEGIGYTIDDAGLLVYLWTRIEELKNVAKPREQSKADVVLAVKKGLLSPEEGYIMLTDLDFTPEAAEFILIVRAESSPFSPVSYGEFKDRTDKYRRIAGMTDKQLPQEIKDLADQVVKLQLEVDAMGRAVKTERRKLNATENVPDSASAELKRIQVAHNRAVSELARIRLEYNDKISQWRRTRE